MGQPTILSQIRPLSKERWIKHDVYVSVMEEVILLEKQGVRASAVLSKFNKFL